MPLNVGGQAGADIPPGRVNAVMETLLRDWSELWWWRRHNDDRLRMRTPGQRQWEQHCCK
jgi:hypothetical protein